MPNQLEPEMVQWMNLPIEPVPWRIDWMNQTILMMTLTMIGMMCSAKAYFRPSVAMVIWRIAQTPFIAPLTVLVPSVVPSLSESESCHFSGLAPPPRMSSISL